MAVSVGLGRRAVLLNAWTLGTAHPDGLLGVIPEMFVFTGVNIVAGFVIAYGWRRKNYHAEFRGKRIQGWICIALALLLVPLANFVFGHYRDALVTLQQEISSYTDYYERWAVLFRTALDAAFSSDEWVPKSMQTVALIFGGVFMAGLVAFKSYRADDPYPGFGKLSRKREKAQDRYVASVEEIKKRIKETVGDATARFSGIASESAAAPALAAEIRNRFELWASAYLTFMDVINTAGKAQLDKYRQTSRGLKRWPETLDAAFDDFAVNEESSAPPPPTRPIGPARKRYRTTA